MKDVPGAYQAVHYGGGPQKMPLEKIVAAIPVQVVVPAGHALRQEQVLVIPARQLSQPGTRGGGRSLLLALVLRGLYLVAEDMIRCRR